ncbi:MAG: rod shape-determining protein MreC [Flavobacteriales bacterium]|nr:rod shape-determining protein MreC [Flavobacteriales bacterium]
MQQLLFFLAKRKHFFLFLFIQIIALWLTIQNKDYHRAKFVNSTGNFIGSVYKFASNWNSYVGLIEENQTLLEENAKLHSILMSSMFKIGENDKQITDTNSNRYTQQYKFTDASVVNNSYRNRNNHITINKGIKHGIKAENGVVTSNGIIGIIESVGENYSSVISLLNKNLLVNAKLKNSNHFGSLSWPGNDRNTFLLSDIPKEAIFAIGDTITTGGYSTIFPAGINIGVVDSYEIPSGDNYYVIKVKSFIDYANIKYVYIIQNLHSRELSTIEKSRNTK